MTVAKHAAGATNKPIVCNISWNHFEIAGTWEIVYTHRLLAAWRMDMLTSCYLVLDCIMATTHTSVALWRLKMISMNV